MQFPFYLLLTYAAFFVCICVYVALQCIVAWMVGINVTRIAIGSNLFFRNFSTKLGGTELSLGLIPIYGSTQLASEDDTKPNHSLSHKPEEDERNLAKRPTYYRELSIGSQAILMTIGPASSLTIGLILMVIPVHFGWKQVAVAQDLPNKIYPSSIPSLGISENSATLTGQASLVNDTMIAFARKSVTGASMADWGGVAAWVVTCASAGTNSFTAWVSCVALIFIGNGLVNLLPIPNLNGGRLLMLLGGAVLGGNNERLEMKLMVVGLLLSLIVCGYLIYRDVIWFIHLDW